MARNGPHESKAQVNPVAVSKICTSGRVDTEICGHDERARQDHASKTMICNDSAWPNSMNMQAPKRFCTGLPPGPWANKSDSDQNNCFTRALGNCQLALNPHIKKEKPETARQLGAKRRGAPDQKQNEAIWLPLASACFRRTSHIVAKC